jgi:diguanylate cyclase (GGDEF)-like protein
MLVALIASLAISYFMPPQYEAVGRFILSPSTSLIQSGSGPNYVLDSLNTLDKTSVMATYAEVMNSDRIYNDALALLQIKPENSLEYTYATTVLPNSSVLELKVRGPDARMAADIANAMGNQTINFTRRYNQVINIDFLDVAAVPTVPYRPQPLRDASLALVLGLVGGMGLALLRDQLLLSMDAFRQRMYVDDATGAFTKKHFVRLVEEELVQNPNDVLSVGVLELSGLQDLIDNFPTIVLQTVLQRVSDSLHKELRGNDIVGRWNAISFMIMLPNTTGAAANRIFERICQALSEPLELGQYDMSVSLDAHIGGAEYGNNLTAQALFEKALSSLEHARMDKKNPFWTEKINAG